MSYILDALRRSQAERERGQVPGLNAQPAAVAAVPLRRGGPPWRWVVAALLAAALAFAVAWLVRSERTARPVAPAQAATDLPAPPGAVPATLPAAGAATTVLLAPAALPVVVSAPPAPVAPQDPGAASGSPPSSSVAPPAAPSAAAPVALPAVVAARSLVAAVPVTALAALTPEQRRDFPPLVLGGSIWSDSALSRFVIVNGQVVREGESAAPGVMIERIGPRTVLLRWREMRLELPL